MKPEVGAFHEASSRALGDERLQRALANAKPGFIAKRRKAFEALDVADALRVEARRIKERTLAHLDEHLESFESRARAAGGHVHWAQSPEEARRIVLDLCRQAGARTITKGKSMVGEEIGLNEALEAEGFVPVETDLGEYIIQLAEEPPSHIIAPAVHKTKDQIATLFRAHHAIERDAESLETVPGIVGEARQVLRSRFLEADVGIVGANFCIAETGSTVIVTNEGNGDLTATLPRMQIVLASLEKVVPTLEDATVLLRLLGRSATGQAITAYTTFFTGPRRPEDLDGPESLHIVLLDHGRAELVDSEFREMLHCIRCGACLNHCPVYGVVGGHAYGWVYPGPMGSVLTPLMLGLKSASVLPNASTLCGRCEEVCPMSIPLPRMLRALRAREHRAGLSARRKRWAMWAWAFLAARPRLFRAVTALGVGLLAWLGGRRGAFRRLLGAGGWTASRDFPAPAGETFQRLWRKRGQRGLAPRIGS